MVMLLLTSALVCVLAWIYLRWSRVKRYWAQLNVPHQPPHPLVGSLTFLMNSNVVLWFKETYGKFKCPYMGIWLFWRPSLVVNSPEIARRVLVKDADIFRDRFLNSGKHDPIGSLNLISVKDPLWSSVRRRLTSVFTSAKLRVLEDLATTKSKELVQRINSDLEKKNLINLRATFTDFTTDIIGIAAFGVASDATLSGDSPLRRITKDFAAFSLYRGLAWVSVIFYPEMTSIFGFTFFPKSATDYFKKIFRTVVSERGGYNREIGESRDFVDALMKMKREAAKDNEDMSEDLLIAQAVVFLQGGFDTSALTLTFATYELAHCPRAQEKLYQELCEAKKNSNGVFDAKRLSELSYLNAVIKETLRKYPPIGWIERVASKDYQIDEKLTITAGTPVYINSIGLHTDSDYFPEPEQFIPERFLPENKDNIKPFTYMPFGEGPRSCIGVRFANQNLRYALAAISQNFKIHPMPNYPKVSEIKMESRGISLAPDEVLTVDFVPRI